MDNTLLREVGAALLAALQMGYHMAELNAPQPYIGCKGVEEPSQDCIPGAGTLALPSSIFALGGLVGSAVAGPAADKFGRRRVFLASAQFYVAGTLFMWISGTVSVLTFGRLLAGLAAGAAIVLTPLYIGEIAPKNFRGLLGSLTQVSINVGILVTQIAGLAWAEGPWRRIIVVGVALSLVSYAMSWFEIKEPKHHDVDPENQVQPISVKEYLTASVYRESVAIAVGIMALQQLTGINAIIFYGVSVLQTALPQYSKLINVFLSIVNLTITGVSAGLVDKYGRKRLLLLSLGGMAAATATLAFALVRDLGLLAAGAATCVIGSFALGIGPIPFLIIGEYTPPQALGSAQSVGTTVSWLATFGVGALFPTLAEWLGPAVFYIFASAAAIGGLVLHFVVRE